MIPILRSGDAEALRRRVMSRSQLENDEVAAQVREKMSSEVRTP